METENKRCPNGERKNPKTGKCEKMSDELRKHKQTLRNKKRNTIQTGIASVIASATTGVTSIVDSLSPIASTRVESQSSSPMVKRSPPMVKRSSPMVKYTRKIRKKSNTSKIIVKPDKIEESSLLEENENIKEIEQGKKRCPNGERKNRKTGNCEKKRNTSEKESEPEVEAEEAEVETEEAEVETEEAETEAEEAEAEEAETESELEKEPEAEKDPDLPPIKTSNKNDFLLQKEKAEYNYFLNNETTNEEASANLYPTLDDPNFNHKIAQRQEFSDTKYDGEITDIRKQSNLLCNAKFELMPHQLFVKNFLSFQTPYNSLLLYHGLGSGKTCSAIGIAEEMRAYMKQIGFTKQIIIVASPNVQDNFKLQLFDERKLELLPDGQWNLNTCIGNSLLQEINPTNLRGLTKEKIISQINTLIRTYYIFMGDKGEFANYIKKKISVPEDAGYTEAEKAILRDKKIKAHFNNRLIIIDEIHNIRISDANRNKLTSVLLNEIARKSNNMRLLLLSATPMYNSYNEIIWLTNLLNANDKRGLIKIEDVFHADGTFVEGGRELLTRKLTGYISYVRGENPYVFPYRIYPDTFDPAHALMMGEETKYPTYQMNQTEITEPLKHVPIYMNGIGDYQKEGYEFIMSYLGLKSNTVVDKRGKARIMPSFENMESFGYTLLLAPLESLIIVYPNPKLDEFIEKKKRLLEKNEEIDYETFSQEENKEVIKSVIGKTGLSNIMKYKTVYDPVPCRFDFEYKPKMLKQYGEIFTPDHIDKYSAKISNICDIIQKPSSGIIIIYSQYIDGGVIPIALALESMGFSRYASTNSHNRNLLKTKKEPIDAITLKKKSEMESDVFKPARYVIITGDKEFSQNNNEDIKYVTNKENINGELVKVILISKAAAEGLDFKHIRQIHILEPWYNMNRIEQIIGRGVRNLSHCGLPFEERNVEIYLHGTILDKDEEAADLYVYRSAEKKAVQIGRVTRLLKEVAVDCQLNIAQTNFTEDKLFEIAENQRVKIHLSSGKNVEFRIGDKPFTDICDYMDNCSFQCLATAAATATAAAANGKDKLISNTYDENFVKNNSTIIMKKIRDLFLERTVYKRNHLINAVNYIKKYPIVHIYYALTRFINNKTETLADKYGRTGHLISKGEYYVFQPNEIIDDSASIYERKVPVDYKRVSLKMELPDAIVSANRQLVENPITVSEPQEKQAITQVSVGLTYQEIIQRMQVIKKILAEKNLTVKASDKNWYKHANIVVPQLMDVHGIPENLINKYIYYHFLDKLPLAEKLNMISTIYSKAVPDSDTGLNIIIQLYFDSLLMEVNGTKAVVLSVGETNQLYVQNAENLAIWTEAEYTDIELFKTVRQSKFTLPLERVNSTEIGFMHPFKGKDIVFKIKDMMQKRNNKGAKCEDASKPVIAEKIGVILDESGIYKDTPIERPELCVILEILMRWITEKNELFQPKGPVLFFGPEMTNEMDISNLHLLR